MKGLIVINRYRIPAESVFQAERLVEEFKGLGVETSIVDNAFLSSKLLGGKLNNDYNVDFAVFLDKDKYQSEILEKCGVKLFNSHSAIRLCDDKGQTYIALANNDINIPKTIFGALCYTKDCKINEDDADKIIQELGFPIIIKESFGSMGKGIYVVNNKVELLTVMESVKLKPHLFQEYVGYKKGVDVRVIVIGGKAVAFMERENKSDFRSNVAQGGMARRVNLPKNFIDTAERCATVLGLDYCGVDLLYKNQSECLVCEVNSNAFIGAIEKTTGVNVCRLYAEHIISNLNK